MKTPNEHRGAGAYFTDPSFHAIILGNLLTIVMAYIEHWSLGEVMLIYWCQSVIIGLVNVYRMVTLKKFSTQGLKMNDQPVPETPEAKRQVAFFFLIHYGFFHFVYFIFLLHDHKDSLDSLNIAAPGQMVIALAVFGFLGSHIYSFLHNKAMDFRDKKPNLGTLMFYPYLRIIPMHLTIILGTQMGGGAMLFFMLLKTLADAGMHIVEHNLFRRPDRRSPSKIND